MDNISAFGFTANIKASNSLKEGFTLTAWADDADPTDVPSVQIADKAMNINGRMVTWDRANPLVLTLNLIPGSEDDKTLTAVVEANRVGKGKTSARDVITLTFTYPDNSTSVFGQGKFTDSNMAKSVSTNGRLKTKTFTLAFESLTQN